MWKKCAGGEEKHLPTATSIQQVISEDSSLQRCEHSVKHFNGSQDFDIDIDTGP